MFFTHARDYVVGALPSIPDHQLSQENLALQLSRNFSPVGGALFSPSSTMQIYNPGNAVYE